MPGSIVPSAVPKRLMHDKRIILAALFLATAALAAFTMWFDVSALPAPGAFETYVATTAKQWLIYRESHRMVLREPAATSQGSENGEMIYQSECAFCHGSGGRQPSDIGRALYPRAPDLGNAQVQNWSDPELFWIIENGIRLSGMPGFGSQLSHREIWDLVRYVRGLKHTNPILRE